MKTESAIDWLMSEVWIRLNLKLEDRERIYEQAKEMFKQQIIEARENGFYSSENWKGDSEQYYKETYEK